ncbi:recombinase family protein [uncultured Ruminobacter sp.]|uniref:recombinase family protein n=1 Tax=uncultured Ruminobacter sp. TaxID=538947 RepID=UPI0025D95E1C|nr:recombinase family protein [uncultured Ruminobacter sp.]
MGKNVITIPATISKTTAVPLGETRKRRVAAYARVLTDMEDQQNSFSAQVLHYTNYIKRHSDWEFVKVYADEGKSGRQVKYRDGFQEMLKDGLDGKFDCLITKSVSRFARNTVDSLQAIRQLKEAGVEVWFEKENIRTFDGRCELMLSLMSSLAQEESRSISENCTWGQRKRFADGKVSVAYSHFLGYDKGADGNLVINKEQAKTVKRIFGMFLKGMTPHGIAKQLTSENIPTPGGASIWSASTIKSMLGNEKYKGDALLQKKFCENFLTKKMKINQGEVPQYYVENNHEAIIEPQIFDMVQAELVRRIGGKNRHSGVHLLSGKIKCGDCGGWYGSKIWHSNNIKYRRIIWRCNQKYEEKDKKCSTPYLDENQIKSRFTIAVNKLLDGSESAIEACEEALAKTLDTSDLEKKQKELLTEMAALNDNIQQMIQINATVPQDQNLYRIRHDEISQEFKEIEAQKKIVDQKIQSAYECRIAMEQFIKNLKKQNTKVTEFSENLWCGLLDYVTVYSGEKLIFRFKNGSEIEA